jgi:hypothetical protein
MLHASTSLLGLVLFMPESLPDRINKRAIRDPSLSVASNVKAGVHLGVWLAALTGKPHEF